MRTNVALPAAAMAFAASLVTLQRTLPAGDSGELIAVADRLGIAHPPGYPLYTLLGHLWLRVFPFGEPATRLAMLSAVLHAMAAGFLAAAARRLGLRPVVALCAALLWAFCAPAWKMSLVAEVFALNSLLAAAMLWVFAGLLADARADGAPSTTNQIDRRLRRRLVALLGLTVLGLSHHHTLLLLALPVDVTALVVVGRRWRRESTRPGGRFVFAVVAIVLVCMTPLLALKLLPSGQPVIAWGDTGPWRGLVHHLLRMDYGTFSLEPQGAGYRPDRPQALLWLEGLPRAFGYAGVVLAVAGLANLAVRARRGEAGVFPWFTALVAYLTLQMLFFTRVGFPTEPACLRGVVERFHVMPALVVALCAGFGLEALARWRAGAATVMGAGAVAAALLLNFSAVNQRGNTFNADLMHNILASLPPDAALFVRGDLLHNGLAYETFVRGRRPDVAWADQELMTHDWYVRGLRRRHPELLPPLDRADRVALIGGKVVGGRLVDQNDQGITLLTASGWQTMARAQVTEIERDLPAAEVFASELSTMNGGRRSEATDRYSGLPGSVNLFWFDHLLKRRPIAVIGEKEASFQRRYELVPHGFIWLVVPKGQAPSLRAQALEAAHLLEIMRLDSYFRRQDSWSFETAERRRVEDMIARAARLLAEPAAQDIRGGDQPGLAILARFLERYDEADSPWNPELVLASGLLRAGHPDFFDPAGAARDLARLRILAAAEPAAAAAASQLQAIMEVNK
jgi:hypothetical protein